MNKRIKYLYLLFRKISLILVFIVLIWSCSKEETNDVKTNYSVGTLSTEVLSHTTTEVVVKVRFYVFDRSYSDNLVPFDISSRIVDTDGSYGATYDSLKRITTTSKGKFSAAVLVTNGYDEDSDMGSLFDMLEPTVRKFIYGSVPENELLIAKAGGNTNPVEIIGNGFLSTPQEADQRLAEICRTGDYVATDTIKLLTAIDSMVNYLNEKSTTSNKHLILMISRRKNFRQELNLYNLLNKISNSHITCHLFELSPIYTWDNTNIHNFLRNINGCTQGMNYQIPSGYYYDYKYSELPMDLLQISGHMPNMMQGNFECFEMIWTLSNSYADFYHGKSYKWSFSVKLNTSTQQSDVDIPVDFYIK